MVAVAAFQGQGLIADAFPVLLPVSVEGFRDRFPVDSASEGWNAQFRFFGGVFGVKLKPGFAQRLRWVG